jgi:hypothetical protein
MNLGMNMVNKGNLCKWVVVEGCKDAKIHRIEDIFPRAIPLNIYLILPYSYDDVSVIDRTDHITPHRTSSLLAHI